MVGEVQVFLKEGKFDRKEISTLQTQEVEEALTEIETKYAAKLAPVSFVNNKTLALGCCIIFIVILVVGASIAVKVGSSATTQEQFGVKSQKTTNSIIAAMVYFVAAVAYLIACVFCLFTAIAMVCVITIDGSKKTKALKAIEHLLAEKNEVLREAGLHMTFEREEVHTFDEQARSVTIVNYFVRISSDTPVPQTYAPPHVPSQ